MKERPAYEGPVDEGSRRMGWLVVAVLSVIIVGIVVLMAFSTVNTPMSVDGDANLHSRWIEDSNP